MRTYDIVEVSPETYAVGRMRTRLFGLLKPKFEQWCPYHFGSVERARRWVEEYEARLAREAHQARMFPRLVEFGYVPCDGKFRQLRDDDL